MEIFVEWENSFSVDNDEIDEQHKKLFNIINEVGNYLNSDDESASLAINKAINELIDYTDYHFRLEENLMLSMEYPRIEEHIEQHKLFETKIRSFKDQIKLFGTTETSQMLFDYVISWLKTHILVLDGDYAGFKKNNR